MSRVKSKNKRVAGRNFLVIVVLLIGFVILTSLMNSGNHLKNKDSDDWKLVLVNKENYISKNYKPKLMTLKDGHQIDERIYSDLQSMFDDARNEGVYPLIWSAYRTKNKQKSIYSEEIKSYMTKGHSKKEAKELANGWVALPGTSEHQLGLALDINGEKDRCTDEKVYIWLKEEAYKYGFILRYPPDKVEITGINHEPWHYRYVGREAAKVIYDEKLCLEKYLERLS